MTCGEAFRRLACAATLLVLVLHPFPGPSSEVPKPGILAAHDPIFIDGNGAFTATNGVTGGQGTALDPYLIEGWDINASDVSNGIGLVIQNTDVHVVVRNVFLHSGGLSGRGIVLYNVRNVVLDGIRSTGNREGVEASGVENGLLIENSYFEGNGNGILLWRASGIIIRNNTFVTDGIAFIGNLPDHYSSHEISGNLVNGKPLAYYHDCADMNLDGIDVGQLIVADCSRVTISRLHVSNTDVGIILAFVDQLVLRQNTMTGKPRITGTDVGIDFHFVTNATIEGNVISDHDYGLSFGGPSSHVVLTANEFMGNTRGLYGWLSEFRIEDNVFAGNWNGLELVAPSHGFVRTNMAQDNEYGFDLGWGHNVSVAGNQARGNGVGISLLLSANMTLVSNNISGRNYGILARHSENLTVAGNEVRDTWAGLYLASTRGSRAYHNNVIGSEVQAVDSGDGNDWDAGYPGAGNYWSNYSGIDRCSGPDQNVCPDPDGIGDVPFRITDRTQDRYPLMEPMRLPDSGVPVIAHSAPPFLEPGEAAAIDVFVASTDGVNRVLVHYGPRGQEEETVEAVYLGTGHYRAWIAAPDQTGILEYYIEVHHSEGNVTAHPKSGKFQITVKASSFQSLPILVLAGLGSMGVASTALYLLVRRRRRRPPVDVRNRGQT